MTVAMSLNLETDLLRTLSAIADTGSFTAAARAVNRTQSAISMQVKKLEESVGQPLFTREGRTVRLTTEGEALLGYARRILKLHDQALARFRQPELSGVVRIGAPDDYVTVFLPRVLARFARAFPGVQVELRCEPSISLRHYVEAGDLDLALLTCGALSAESQAVRNEPLVWATSTAHAVHMEDPLPLAVFQNPCQVREATLRALDSIGRPYRLAYVSPSQAGLLAAVNAGLAVTTLGRSWLPPGLRLLTAREGFPDLPKLGITLERAPRHRSAAAEALADAILDAFREDEATAA